ncbi:EcoAI/FtnUII family type I restriction enzme subunit R [Campylobacter lari]|uniref:EcoAI/FtnUII family type I restriction enzme subunit R n=3 Tax=Campylobacter TaxID=194 RepID=UPI0012CF2F4D|nr:type I restriction endonuclease subunit R [Campylobacter lari]EAK9961700.1 DEAD/DEAH box helicase [Campylobacter lari]MCV3338870.1 DEAD/DEAH box helicase family protein [Campylobacter lari]MCV3361240.1 DEAD/DEAH box helicase family protein [Campylobacter lari]MCV3367181.1 DEAD/DEAH box helicase family protein [Campylobacter lari]MCV3389471.1 DEAD/DEAH box helicase family protein [Campylobacter lari]
MELKHFSEDDTRVKLIDVKLHASSWSEENIIRNYYFTDGRKLIGNKRGERKFADYLLKFQNNNLAIIEAKKQSKDPLDGLSQGIEYARILNVAFVYSTNGDKIYEYNLKTSSGEYIENFPTPSELFARIYGNLKEWQHKLLSQRELYIPQKELRYYQKIAVDKVIEALINGKNRILLTLATGTGKTTIAFALCYRLLEARWNKTNQDKKPKILFLCDRVSLRDQALGEFNPIEGDCVAVSAQELRKNNGRVPTSANVFFGIYQSLASNSKEQENANEEQESKFYLQYPKDFFDLIIIDECHRGGANEEGSWAGVLEYFSSATHLGLTATPKKSDNVDTYRYFGESIYEYSLKDGIEDGFLTPYKVKRVTTTLSEGYVYNPDDIIEGELEKGFYKINEFERNIHLPQYNDFLAKEILKLINPMDKTIIFCANQAHASEVKRAIDKFKSVKRDDYCVRVTSDEGKIGLEYLKQFQDNDKSYPVILTSSKMLTTGVDARNVRNIVLLANIGSIIEFKQIIGRGTRVYEGKDFFTIIDFVGATKLFYDPKWDGEQVKDEDKEDKSEIWGKQNKKESDKTKETESKKAITVHLKGTKLKVLDINTSYLGSNGKPLSTKEFLEFLIGKLAEYYDDEVKLREIWSKQETRLNFLKTLEKDGVDENALKDLGEIFDKKDCDIYDVLAHLSFNAEIKTRQERVLQVEKSEFLKRFQKEKALKFIEFLLGRYQRYGIKDFDRSLAPLIELSSLGNVKEIVSEFGGVENLKQSVDDLQREIYAR